MRVRVAILVIVEYALMHNCSYTHYNKTNPVAILVIVEYALMRKHGYSFAISQKCRNPCYSGICINAGSQFLTKQKSIISRNPCYSGICINAGCLAYLTTRRWIVAILVIVEYALMRKPIKTRTILKRLVAILVIVEYALMHE